MWKYLLIFLTSWQLNAQIIVTSFRTKSLITDNVKEFNKISFPKIPYRQPIVYINYSPLRNSIAGITRQLKHGIYIIDINPLYPIEHQNKTLIHELVHVQQFYSNRLAQNENGFFWLDIEYPYTTQYNKRPWEIEARVVSTYYCKKK